MAAICACLMVPVFVVEQPVMNLECRTQRTRDMHDVRDVPPPLNRRQEGYASPCNLVLVTRDTYDAHICRRGVVLD